MRTLPLLLSLVLLVSLVALAVVGLVSLGGDDGDEGTATEATVPPDTTAAARFPAETRAEACNRSTAVAIRRCSRKLSPEQVQELERGEQAQDLRRAANDWASRFAAIRCKPYRIETLRRTEVGHEIQLLPGEPGLVNCKRLSAAYPAFQRSFADATVEDIKFKGIELRHPSQSPYYLAAVKFSNGVVVKFVGPFCAGPGSCSWPPAHPNRRFVQAATTPP